LIVKALLPGSLFYETIPQLAEFVYLKAKLENTLAFPLLPGSVLVFRNESYMGKSAIKYTAPGEPFCLSFGIDDDLKVRRIEHANITRPAKGLSNKNTREWEYHYILYNYKKIPERVSLCEGIYVSELKEVNVTICDDTTEGYSVDPDGILSWESGLSPDPFDHKKYILRYTITAPKDFNLDGL
jgi:uncharacterized protein (TIGR02231 family)